MGSICFKMELHNKISLDSKLLLDILENVSTAIIVLNEDDTYFFINTAGLNLLGISNKFPDISNLKSALNHKSLEQHIHSVRKQNHSKMIKINSGFAPMK